MTWLLVVRWVHILAATAWFGQVVTISFVLVPAAKRLSPEARSRFLVEVFPRILRLASVLSATAVLTGTTMFWWRFSGAWSTLVTTQSGLAFLVGATLGLTLTIFHFVLEPRLQGAICVAAERPLGPESERVMWTLQVVPQVGMGVIMTALLLMMIGARGC